MKNTIKMKISLALGYAAAIVALAPICGNASDFGMPSKAVVKYSDLDINTEAGARALFHRLMKAADEICPVDATTHYLNRIENTCVYATMTKAVRDVNSAALSKFYAARTGIKVATYADERSLAMQK